MKVWKVKETYKVTDTELEKILNDMQKSGEVIKEIFAVDFDDKTITPSYYGTYKIIYTTEDTEE